MKFQLHRRHHPTTTLLLHRRRHYSQVHDSDFWLLKMKFCVEGWRNARVYVQIESGEEVLGFHSYNFGEPGTRNDRINCNFIKPWN
ncbi:hypothetical protein L1987_57461 [Smallanthus sonchifolius]|uniref:Uncharacterized protein n=1 Tax=Smallanthus sonchifolius TaxID=185202 RepID=A0ACB9DCS0_9ASTR|nr:hypothetical protein L1987_57461 [Smallanthus sonchifolius]